MRLIDSLVYPLNECEELQPFWAKLDAGEDAVCGISQSARSFLVAARFARTPQPTLVVLASQDAAYDFARSLAAYVGDSNVLHYRERSDSPWKEASPKSADIAKRMEALHALQTGKDILVVSSVRALMRLLPPASSNVCEPIIFEQDKAARYCNKEVPYDDIPALLESIGYVNTGEIEGPGSFTTKGGTIDIFPGNSSFPVRLDYFGDALEDIRRIVGSTGQTISSLSSIEVYPVIELNPSNRALAHARDILHNPAKTNPVLRELLEKIEGGLRSDNYDALLPYLYDKPAQPASFFSEETLSVLIEPRSLIDDALHYFDDLSVLATGSSIPVEGLYTQPAQLSFGSNQRATYQSVMRVGTQLDAEMPVKRSDVAGDPEKLFGRLRSLIEGSYITLLSVPNIRAREDIKLELVDRGLPIQEITTSDASIASRLKPGIVYVIDADVALGIILPKAKIALISLSDTQGAQHVRTSKQVDITDITFPYSPGDYVVHAAHGIALFKDLVRREVGGIERDYLLLEYASEDKLYVPVEQFDRVTRYVGPEGSSPRLTRLNTSDWTRAITKARKASRKLAFDLVDVYSRRASTLGYSYGPDTPWQHQMEEDFPYEETQDQLRAIAEVKADMASTRPMDRLVCGDVGFGKTEVALRAAFKATQAGKQVMVLCPTTILAQQHYSTFVDRFSPYGVRVDVLSRFRTPVQQKESLEGFADGSVEVLIGTHRLLSRDVNPRDLGLVIIDEEQRFGVGHKEQMKNLRESIDVLTLSATPIPRTMQMSLSGVRDMSLILTPPDDRRPVEVYVGEWDPDVVSGAIQRELERNGQVYYVSNRVRTMDDALNRVQAAAPGARVGVAHGQMGKEELESIMEDFSAGAIDVLVATTIIESGIDNPHTNTLIIEDSQRLGLAQMYQLKGRVGRSSRQAYAYFMFPEQIPLTEDALARLNAINEHQELGSGMRVAMRDLEIRGAGTLLGAEQSGNLSAVGFDLFAQMLAYAVNETREGKHGKEAELPPALSDITVNIPVHAYIPEEYVPDAEQRVLLYRKTASAESVAQVERIRSEALAKHGPAPQATINYFMKAEIKALANELGCKNVSIAAGKISLEPIAQPKGQAWEALRKVKARYIPATKKLQIPVKFFALEEDGSIAEALRDYLQGLVAAKQNG